MPTKRQLAANRRNAEKSTGPRTRAGKTAVDRNATKHGLLSREVLLPSEDEAGLMELGNRLRAELQPSGELEIAFVDRITAALWRLRRLGQIEAGLITFQRYSIQANEARREAEGYTEPADADLRRLFQPTVTDESRHAAAMNRADEAAGRMNEETPVMGRAFAAGGTTFTTLARYEAAIDRGLYRALHELQRLQKARLGGDVLPPLAVDVDVSSAVSA